MSTRRLLAIVTTRSTGRTHILASQTATYSELAIRRHDRETLCGRKVDGRAGEHLAGIYGGMRDCRQCYLVAQGRGWMTEYGDYRMRACPDCNGEGQFEEGSE